MSNDDTALTPDSGERYERGERIATGGMGEVWRARDTVLDREVAVKILKHEYADDPTFRARFEAEARHAAGLHHPGIASVFDYGLLKDGRSPYLVMELVNGKPLSELLADGRPFDPEQARALALQTAEALAVAHRAGVVHRDVKPGNLLVTPEGQVKITDFGIARAADSVAFTQTGQIVGTPHYLAPEQARGDAATAASDVYALGVVLFECLSGRRPFSADTPIATALAQIQQDVPPLPDTVPAGLSAVVTRALAKDPADRYADGAELATALRGAADGADPAPAIDQTRVLAATPPTSTTRVTTTSSAPEPVAAAAGGRSRWPLYTAIALILILLVALLIASPWSDDETTGGNDSADTVKVNKAAYVGKPEDEVRDALGEKGLETKVETEENPGGEEAGTVSDLSPTGVVDKGEVITLQVWDDPPAPETEEPDNSGEGNEEKPEEKPKPEKTEAPKPEKNEKPDKGKPEDPGQQNPTDELTEGAPVDPAAAEGPGSNARELPDQGNDQSGTGKRA